jgi:diguanylate cyclase (GGDEF)-like protein
VPIKRRPAAATSRGPTPLYGPDLATRLRRSQRTSFRRLTRRETLIDLVTAVHATIEPDEVAQAVVERVGQWLPLGCWAVVAPEVHGQLGVLAESGVAPGLGPAVNAVAGWVIQHDTLLASADLRSDRLVGSSTAAAVLAFPLRGREHVVGALVGIDRGVSRLVPRPAAAVVRAMDTLLAPAAAVLETALLLKRTEALSVTDDLTRLYNSRYLNHVLRRETKLAVRTGRSLSLLFIDLDGFKSINDKHGHLAGSRALVEAGAVIRGSARETDIVARFGGDEFALILPDTGPTGALAVAERIRDRIARHSFLAGEGLDIRITASVGVATLPDVAVAADELVQAADAAMYRVKDRGKNGIQAAASNR